VTLSEFLQVIFADTSKPRLLKLSNFSWDANEISGKFQGCKTTERFIATFKELFTSSEIAQDVLATDNEEESGALQPPCKKRAKITMPASRQARMESQVNRNGSLLQEDCDEFDETEMDKAIHSLFQGENDCELTI